MKKALLIVFVLAAFSHTKAQQFFNVKPSDSLKNNLLEQYFKVQPKSQLPWSLPQVNLNNTLAALGSTVKISTYDHMPIAFLQGDSKMPVVKPGGYDKMPVLKLGNDSVKVIADTKKQTP